MVRMGQRHHQRGTVMAARTEEEEDEEAEGAMGGLAFPNGKLAQPFVHAPNPLEEELHRNVSIQIHVGESTDVATRVRPSARIFG